MSTADRDDSHDGDGSGYGFAIDALESTTDYFVEFDREFCYRYVNARATGFCGKSREAVIGTQFWDFVPEFRGSELDVAFRRAIDTGIAEHFEFYWDKPPVQSWLEIHAYPRLSGLAVFFRDITVEKSTQAALRESESRLKQVNAELEHRVREQTLELETANREMEAFTYSVSHDLRTPLRAIVATSRIIIEESRERLTPEDIYLLQRQADNASRMACLIDDLLKLSRLSREPLHRKKLDLTSMAEAIANELLGSTACRIEIEPNMICQGDSHLIEIALANLMENACKFSPDGGTVRCGSTESNGDRVFFVSDEGMGFDMKYSQRLFHPFERLVTRDAFPGTGIGLANVQRIVQRHGGRVWVQSELGKGSTFFFTLS